MACSSITAQKIAQYVIWLAHEHGSFISNLKLQKLLYYAQGWHLALHDGPLFSDPIEAWVHGPVVPTVYRRFKHFGFGNIDELMEAPLLPDEAMQFLEELAREYLGLDAYALELMTHREPPWQRARVGKRPEQASRKEIALEDMRAYFTSLLREAPRI